MRRPLGRFEAHITLPRDEADRARAAGEFFDWSFSAIDGDPVMGKQAYCYLTKFDVSSTDLMDDMADVCKELAHSGIPVLRRKVEEILYDSKTGWDVLQAA